MLLKSLQFSIMNNNRSWSILNSNIRGINSDNKWLAIKQKVEESAAGILFLQETKREAFDSAYLKNFFPRRTNKFDYSPSVGASGGLLVAWNAYMFHAECLFKNGYSISIRFTSMHNGSS